MRIHEHRGDKYEKKEKENPSKVDAKAAKTFRKSMKIDGNRPMGSCRGNVGYYDSMLRAAYHRCASGSCVLITNPVGFRTQSCSTQVKSMVCEPFLAHPYH